MRHAATHLCPLCHLRSRFSLCTVCFTRLTLEPESYAHLQGAQLQALYIAAKERAEYYESLQRDLWHQLKPVPIFEGSHEGGGGSIH